MTPEQEAYRDAWVAEMWPTVHQWVQPIDLTPPVDKTVEKRPGRAA